MTLQLQYAAHSEIGLVRKNNQDSGYASPRLLVVADGMGGAAAGDLASAAAVQQLRRADRGASENLIEGEQMLELLAGALDQANEKIADLVASDPELEGMGTTVTAALFDGAQLGVVHIGDSRAYLLRGDELIRLSHDHSWVQSLVDEGRLTPVEAAYHPHRSLLLKVLNGQPNNDPDTALVDVEAGDRLLFCSDGLCGLVEDDELAAILTTSPDRDEVMTGLVQAAHREGGVDNITIILADVITAEVATAETEADSAAEPAAAVVGAAVDREIPVVGPRPIETETAPTQVIDSPATAEPEAPAEEDPETTRYAPTLRTGRRRMWRVVLVVVLVAALLGGGLGAGYAWSRTQFYVGPEADKVAIHRGLAQTVLGIPLSDVYEVTDINLADLSRNYRAQVEKTIPAHTLAEAEATTAELRTEADRCIRLREERAKPTPAPTPPGETPPGIPPNPEIPPGTEPTTTPPGEPTPPTPLAPTTAPTAGPNSAEEC